jgi:hypothetical protein
MTWMLKMNYYQLIIVSVIICTSMKMTLTQLPFSYYPHHHVGEYGHWHHFQHRHSAALSIY